MVSRDAAGSLHGSDSAQAAAGIDVDRRGRKRVDYSNFPFIKLFQARDGTWLGYRRCTPVGSPAGRGAIVIHGSSGSSGTTIHVLSGGLSIRGVDTRAVDIRGHGTSGTPGDTAYVDQLEDDLVDFIHELRVTTPSRLSLTLIGHSAGAGFALRVVTSSIRVDQEHICARCPRCAAPRLRCPEQSPEFRQLGEPEHPADSWTDGASQIRHQLLQFVAGAGLRSVGGFRKTSH